MAIEPVFKDENGNKLEQTLIIDAEFIMKDDFLKDYFLDKFYNRYDECVCSLNESQSHCECGGVFNESLVLAEIGDI